MKIVVTGGRGFLGRHIEPALAQKHEVTVTDIKELDVRDGPRLAAYLGETRPDAVLHLAALCGAIPSTKDPFGYFDTNLTGTLKVLEACRVARVPRLCFTSSLTVFGSCKDAPVTETSPFAPRHPYAASKAASEIAIKSYADQYGLSVIVLRPTLVVGEGCTELHAIGDFLRTLMAGDTVKIFGDGSHVRDFIHPEDVADAVASVFKWWDDGASPGFESFNFSSGEYPSMQGLAEMVLAELASEDQSRIAFTGPTGQTFSLYTTNEKAERVLGWHPKVRLADIIHRLRVDFLAKVETRL